MTTTGGQLLLILASSAVQSAAELIAASRHGPTETLRSLTQLVEQGFVVVTTPAGEAAAYRLNPKGGRSEPADSHRRILLVEDNAAVQDLMHLILEDAGYAVVVSRTPTDATALLDAVTFDLVITDSFSPTPTAIGQSTLDLRTAAGTTPVALFTAHRVELDAARAAGFRDLLTKPFEITALEEHVRALLH